MPLPLNLDVEALGLLAVLAVAAVVIDLRSQGDSRDISLRRAAIWSAVWLVLGSSFGGYLYWRRGARAAELFFSGYVLEKCLSVDNLMVFIAIFSYFRIRGALQHRILYFGIVAAIGLRLVFVSAAGVLLLLGPWADAVLALVVGLSAVKMLGAGGGSDDDVAPDYASHPAVRLVSRWFHVVPHLDGERFLLDRARAEELTRLHGGSLPAGGLRFATPALVCLAVVELSDVLFAFDSVPTVVAVTHDPVLIYAAMILAVLGLRSLYFVLAALTQHLVHLEKSVIVLLFFIAAKLGLHASNELTHWPGWEPTPGQSLLVILFVLVAGVVSSKVFPRPSPAPSGGEPPSGSPTR